VSKKLNPSEVARETLRQLAMQRKLPTPDNYRDLYHEIAGTAAKEPFPALQLKAVFAGLPRNTAEQAKLARALDTALTAENWQALSSTLSEFVEKSAAEPPNWANAIRSLLTQLQNRHTGLTMARKREALDHVLSSSGSSELLFNRLQSVIHSWGQNAAAAETESEESPVVETDAPVSKGSGLHELQELVGDLLDNVVSVVLIDVPDLVAEAHTLAIAVRAAQSVDEMRRLAERLKKFSYKLHFTAEDQTELKVALQHLVQLIIDNINELVVDDRWLSGQVGIVRELMNEPLTLRRLDDVERRMKDVIFKQSALKHSLNDAKERLKEMLATFVDRLASFSESTSGYHDTIEKCAVRITRANDISELSDVLDEVMRETRVVQLDAQRSRDEMRTMRQRVDDAEREVARLQTELAQASDMVRTDPLTGALNRKGMDEALERETARSRRHSGTLCMALLDIDNFKKLNDGLGHAAGDAALIHLTKVTQETIRPQDTLARYGGEEFVVLLPNTSIEDAVTAMVRVQRELTRRFFLHNNEKVLITFSCGVAELGNEEDPHETLKRADNAMYLAKRAGKNRVLAA
jgi:diguanylate cyclase